MPDRIDAIMQTDFRALSPETPIREAIAALVDGAVSAAPVVDADGRLVGILTQRDCFRPALNASYYQQWTGKVADHQTTGVTTLDASTDFVTAAEAFLERPYRSYPVMRGERLVGMLHRGDLLAALLSAG